MFELLIHLVKSSAILALFYICYILFLKKETFFDKNRWFLFSGLILAFALPFYKMQRIVYVNLVPVMENTGNNIGIQQNELKQASFWADWSNIFIGLYIIVGTILLIRLLIQLLSLKWLTQNSEVNNKSGIYHVRTKKPVAPFSFFKYIFYYPLQFERVELKSIIAHEEVHVRQYHTMDILLMEITRVLLWFNPFVWAYRTSVKQNLEFIADAHACSTVDKKAYQYLMLKQITGQNNYTLSNSFYNSLIKKRIVMLNQNQSKTMNFLKSILILPVLGLFLVSFNTDKIYQFKTSPDMQQTNQLKKSIELTINKNTTDAELKKMKQDLAEKGIDFSYTIVHNKDKEIVDISLKISGEGENRGIFKNSYNSSNDEGIAPMVIFIDLENNQVSIGAKDSYKSKRIKINNSNKKIWISSGDDSDEEVIIKKENGSNKIFINGEEVDKDELHKHNIKIHIDDEDSESEGNVFIMKNSNEDSNIEVISENEGFLFINTDEGKTPLYIINGKKSTQKALKKLFPGKIESINILKGDAAEKKYGNDAKDGVIEITTKKKN